MKIIAAAALIASALVATPAMANLDLAKKSGCMACHAVDKKIVGPSYQDVAKKYTPADEAKVTEKIIKGGAGVWGPVPMPAKGGNTALKDDAAKALAKWILAGAK